MCCSVHVIDTSLSRGLVRSIKICIHHVCAYCTYLYHIHACTYTYLCTSRTHIYIHIYTSLHMRTVNLYTFISHTWQMRRGGSRRCLPLIHLYIVCCSVLQCVAVCSIKAVFTTHTRTYTHIYITCMRTVNLYVYIKHSYRCAGVHQGRIYHSYTYT